MKKAPRKRLGIGGQKKKERKYRKNGYQNTYGERRKRRRQDRNKEGMERKGKGKTTRKKATRKRAEIGGKKNKEGKYRKKGYQRTYGDRRKRRRQEINQEGRSVSSECSDWHVTPITETFPQGVNPAPAKREEKRCRKMATPDARKINRTSSEKGKYQGTRPKGEEDNMETEGRRGPRTNNTGEKGKQNERTKTRTRKRAKTRTRK